MTPSAVEVISHLQTQRPVSSISEKSAGSTSKHACFPAKDIFLCDYYQFKSPLFLMGTQAPSLVNQVLARVQDWGWDDRLSM